MMSKVHLHNSPVNRSNSKIKLKKSNEICNLDFQVERDARWIQ